MPVREATRLTSPLPPPQPNRLLTVFLRKYSDASSTEVGTLLMVLPFIAVFTKPFFCALADRHRKYKLYFILALLFTLIGFGLYTILPFFPEFIKNNGRLSWYMLVLCTILGYIAYGVVWSLGDAYAANVSHKTGESFGMIRLWGTVGWGVAGAVVGLVSPYLNLPEMVLGFLIFVVVFVFEIALLIWWPHNDDFEMGDAIPDHSMEASKPAATIQDKSVLGSLDLDMDAASLKLSALATMDQKPKLTEAALSQRQPAGSLSIERTKSNSVKIVAKIKLDKDIERVTVTSADEDEQRARRDKISQLQMTIFKMVAMKHKSLLKYLLIFVALGTVYNIHWSFFFLHLDRLASEGKGGDFSTLVGLCLVAQAVGETLCFMIAPWVVKKLGRDGSISLNAIAYAVRYFGNGLGIPLVSPYVAIITESLQGINYGIFYYLITDTALHYALMVDEIIPELREQNLIDDRDDLNQVRTSLRATMQGIFSGAFDGLGFGLGSLIAGLVLEGHSYEQLWCFAGTGALIIFFLHAIYEILNQLIRAQFRRRASSLAPSPNPARADLDSFGAMRNSINDYNKMLSA